LGIWSDVPQQGTNSSRPGQLLWPASLGPLSQPEAWGTRTYNEYTNYQQSGFCVHYGEFVFDVTNTPFIQTTGNVYWLSVGVPCHPPLMPDGVLFGLQTCPTNWNGGVAVSHMNSTNWNSLGDWQPGNQALA